MAILIKMMDDKDDEDDGGTIHCDTSNKNSPVVVVEISEIR